MENLEKQLIEALQKQVELLEQLVRAKDALILEMQLKQTFQPQIIIQQPQIQPLNPWQPFTPPYIVTSDALQLVQPLNRTGQNGR